MPGPSAVRYGGNTSCVEVRCDNRLLIIDAGTGIISLGKEEKIKDADILLSHTHLDHIQGFPFFKPFYSKESNIRVWGGHLDKGGTRAAIKKIMQPPVFPVPLSGLHAKPKFIDFKAGEDLSAPQFKKNGIKIKTFCLNHPDNATAFRVEYGGKSICYVSDVEHKQGKIDTALVEFIKNTNILIYDSTFCETKFKNHIGWGHSTWQHGALVADEANVSMFVAFHHDPELSDEALDERERHMQHLRKNSVMAREGMTLEP